MNIVSVTPVVVSGPQTSPIFTGLGAGTYNITVTDGFGCTATSANVTINEPTQVIARLDKSKILTCLTQAELTISATGGTGPYEYATDASFATILGSFVTSDTFAVPAGVYQYFVRDANGCVGVISDQITVDPLESLEIELDLNNAIVKCTGDASGVIVAIASGGLGNYMYTLLDGSGNVLAGPQAEGRFEALVQGTYSVRVQSDDCTRISDIIPINQPTTVFTAVSVPTHVSCFGGNDGRIVVTGSGGTGAYVYSISPRSDQYFNDGVFENLPAGTYTILANDENGCPYREDVVINQPIAPLSVTLTPDSLMPEECVGDLNGAFTIDIAGGTLPYSYSLNAINGPYTEITGTQHTFDNLAGGVYTVFIKDFGGCPQEIPVSVGMPVDMKPTAETDYGCETNTVTVDIEDNVDKNEVDYALDNIAGPYQLSEIFTDVLPGSHVIYARYANGCIQETASFTIQPFAELILTESAGPGEMNVISVTATGGAPAYEYSFNGEPFTSDNKYKIYKTGVYKVIVRDQNGCEAELDVPMTYIDVCIPNYFTPNGDGLYDEWGPGCTNIYNNLEFSIFDRYGRVIAKYRYGQKWDGRYNGEELPTGDYWYVLKLNDEKDAREFVGHFTLYR